MHIHEIEVEMEKKEKGGNENLETRKSPIVPQREILCIAFKAENSPIAFQGVVQFDAVV